jgi:very-short-patch-repair endonuclease
MIAQRPPSITENKIICICKLCGAEFESYPSWVARGESRFCSHSCAAIYRNHVKGIQSPTSIERLLIDELNRRNVAYVFQYPFKRAVMDFAFPDARLCVEADGIYWHSLPNVQEKDAMRDQLFHNHGWIAIHFTGDEIRESAERCVDVIERALFELRNPIIHLATIYP